jgi:hypothetical protein
VDTGFAIKIMLNKRLERRSDAIRTDFALACAKLAYIGVFFLEFGEIHDGDVKLNLIKLRTTTAGTAKNI